LGWRRLHDFFANAWRLFANAWQLNDWPRRRVHPRDDFAAQRLRRDERRIRRNSGIHFA
jgi:hypothetical protein